MLKAAKNVFKGDQAPCPVVPLEPRRDVGNQIAVVACGDFIAPQEKFLKVCGRTREHVLLKIAPSLTMTMF